MSDKRVLIRGAEALGMGALMAGLNAFFGYPITPSSEIPEFLSRMIGDKRFPWFKVFLQAASEIESVNMLLGAGAIGMKAMTATSGPGLSLMAEGISYGVGSEIPFVIVNVNRGGPGLGNIAPEQSDYFLATKAAGHGDSRPIVLAPSTVEEMYFHPYLAFTLAFRYRIPVIILTDGFIAHLTEDVTPPEILPNLDDVSWALRANKETRNIICSIHLKPEEMREFKQRMKDKYKVIAWREARCEKFMTEDADLAFVAFGMAARVAKKAVKLLRRQGIRAGLLRPITLNPLPKRDLRELSRKVKALITVEMSMGQFYEDVQLSAIDKDGVYSIAYPGGDVPPSSMLVEQALECLEVKG